MKFRTRSVAIASLVALATAVTPPAATSAAAQATGQPLRYPDAVRGGHIDEIGGVRVSDPFRWLEDNSADVRAWLDAETALTASYLGQLGAPGRLRIRDRITQFWNYPKLRPPFFGGERFFYYLNTGLENHATLYVQDRFDAPPRVLIDPAKLSADGSVAIVNDAASPDGHYLAYGVSTRGGPWQEVRVREIRPNQDLADTVRGIVHSRIAWTNDERGFFYVRTGADSAERAANPFAVLRGDRVFYHRLGNAQARDQLIYERADHPDWVLDVTVSEDGQYAVIDAHRGADPENRLFFIDLDKPRRPNVGAPIVTLFDVADAAYEFVSSEGSLFYVMTTKDAPHGRVAAVDINAPHPSRWLAVVRETFDALLDARRIGDRIVAHRFHDAHSLLQLYDLNGGARGEIHLPSVGAVAEISGRAQDQEFYYSFTSFLVPPTIFRYDMETRVSLSYRDARTEVDLSNYETTELFYTSADGARIPMSITARRDIVLDGTHPTLLAGYGAFGTPFMPAFSPEVAAWVEMGGVYAVAHVRGGGEYGRAWHEGGMRAHKSTSVSDFIAAAEFLISQKYTRSASLAIGGEGHGGLLVAAALTQRPQLFGAALVDGGALDMARFDRFTTGWTWTSEYGWPGEPAQLKSLLEYSPVHTVRDGTRYPATLITAGDRDGVVAPIHSYKFAAALQTAQTAQPAGPPALLRVERGAGHGATTPTAKRIDVATDRLVFLWLALGLPR